MKVTWSAQGRATAAIAVACTARDRPSAAAHWLEKLLDSVASLGHFPAKGRSVPELNKPDHREILVAPYRVIYRVEATRVYVLVVWHDRRMLAESDLESR